MSDESDETLIPSKAAQTEGILRSESGRFLRGTAPGPGRPPDVLGPTVRKLLTGEKLEAHILKVIAAADAGDMRAVQLLWDRGWGKPAMSEEDREALRDREGVDALAVLLRLKQ